MIVCVTLALSVISVLNYRPDGAKNTALGPSITAKEHVLSAFPALSIDPNPPLGFLAYYDQMVGGMANGSKIGKIDGSYQIPGGTMGGSSRLLFH